MDENKEKKADNTNIEAKQKINKIDNEIENATKGIKKLESMKESFIKINKSLDKCYNLLQYSMYSKEKSIQYDENSNNNIKMLNELTEHIDKGKRYLNQRIEILNSEKEKIQKNKRDKESEEKD